MPYRVLDPGQVSCRDVAKELGLSRQRVEQVSAMAIAWLLRVRALFDMLKEAEMWEELEELRTSQWAPLEDWGTYVG